MTPPSGAPDAAVIRLAHFLSRIITVLAAPVVDVAVAPLLALAALLARALPRPVDVGLGPQPLINNIYHKQALQLYGYSAETFVNAVYYITDEFDFRGDRLFRGPFRLLLPSVLFLRAIFRYRILYLYFNGGPLAWTPLLGPLEPHLFRLAGVRTVVLPYGSDVQDMSRSPSLLFKHTMSRDYPQHRRRRAGIQARIDRWSSHGSHVVGGCEWVDYLHHWDTLMLAHFAIDTDRWRPVPRKGPSAERVRILHAPNHRHIKGTAYFVRAVEELAAEGLPVELVIVERVPNRRMRDLIAEADIIADQLVVGWYAMFALEAMSMEKPVLCHLRQDLLDLYTAVGLVEPGEVPVVNCSPRTVKDVVRALVRDKASLAALGRRSRAFVLRHHSLDAVGGALSAINRSLGVEPSRPKPATVTPPSPAEASDALVASS